MSTDYQALVRQLFEEGSNRLQHDSTLPACPLCGAPAIAGYRYAHRFDLAHDCNCDLYAEERYYPGLTRLWAGQGYARSFVDGLPLAYRHYRLENLPLGAGNREAVHAASRLDGHNLYIHGEPGTGKTHLAVGVAYRYAASGLSARFHSANLLIQELRTWVGLQDLRSDQRPRRPDLCTPQVLILDDLGKLRGTDFVYEQLYNALEWRVTNGRTTIVTAQRPPGQVALSLTPSGQEDAAGALASRLGSGHVVQITGEDHRYRGGSP